MVIKSLLCTFPVLLAALTAHGASLELSRSPEPEPGVPAPLLRGQLPHSRVARGEGAIAMAYLSSPTSRYDHGVLGDDIEAASLTVFLEDGTELRYELPERRVFEDLEPRLLDLDADGADEVIVVETDIELGASLAVYGLREGRLTRVAASSFIGRPHRWLNPLGAGDFNGDSVTDIAVVLTPHIGGVLELYSYTPPILTGYARMGGVSTHFIGGKAPGMGRVVRGDQKDLILAPTQRRDVLLLLEWVDGGIEEKGRVSLPSEIVSELAPAGENRWVFRIGDGSWYSVKVIF